MKKYVFYCLFSFMLGFILCLGISNAYANSSSNPIVTNVQNMQGNVSTQIVYVEGQRYVVFTSGASSLAVIKK